MEISSNLSTLNVSNAISRLTMEETRDLVFQNGVPLNVLKDVAAQYDGENRKQNYVQAWLDMDTDASWDKLVAGLRKVNKNSLAAEIESQHLSRAPVPSSTSPSLLSTSSSISISATPPANTPSHLQTATQAPVPPTPTNTSHTFEQKVAAAKDSVEQLQEEFFDLKSDTRQSLTKKENEDPNFFHKFQDYLLEMPVTKKQVHIRFFTRNEEEILDAKNIRKLFVILGRYCNYSNYEIIFHVVKKFCHHELKGRMLRYRDSLTSFEKSTTVDVYLCAISARPGGEISKGFIRMTMKINKPPSECTLYEIRELKESIEEKASLESYAMYIETPEEGSVCVRLLVPWEVYSLVSAVLTTEFREERLLTKVMVKRSTVTKNFLVRTWNITCMSLWTLESTGTVFKFPDGNMFELEKLAVIRLVVQPMVMHNHTLTLYQSECVCLCVDNYSYVTLYEGAYLLSVYCEECAEGFRL